MRRGVALRLLLAAILAGGCRCEEWIPIGDVRAEFRIEPGVVDFGRVLEGNIVLRTLRVVSVSRSTQELRFFTEPPFTAPEPVTLLAGQTVELEVRFDARDTSSQGELVAVADGAVQLVRLLGEGVRPLQCRPSAECRVATFDLETNSCVETVANDGLPCTLSDLCLDNTTCRAGVCVGEPRSCDDANVCTTDSCSPSFGCVFRPVRCPRSANPCLEPICDAVEGCGLTDAPDLTPCGEFSCVEGNFCVSGACLEVPTPDGIVCAPPTPCQGEGTCQAQECVRPDAGELTPSLTFTLPSGPGEAHGDDPALVAHEGNLFVELCDGGCALASWTSNGFERFVSPHEDGAPRRVLGVTGEGVWVAATSVLELYDVDTGNLKRAFPLTTSDYEASLSPSAFAIDSLGTLWAAVQWTPDAGEEGGEADAGEVADDEGAADAGPKVLALLRLPPDGGSQLTPLFEDVWTPPELAMDEADALYVLVPGDFVQRFRADDGGAPALHWEAPVAGGPGLQLAHGRMLIGGSELLRAEDGGLVGQLIDAGAEREPVTPLTRHLLMTSTASFGLYRSCTTPLSPPCADEEQGTWVRSFNPEDAGVHWNAQVISPELPGFVEAMVNVDGGVALLTQRFPDGGAPRLYLQGYFDGDEYLNCSLEGGGNVGAALFEGSALYLLRERDGGWTFDAYDFSGAPLDYSGWGSRGSLGGTRRAR